MSKKHKKHFRRYKEFSIQETSDRSVPIPDFSAIPQEANVEPIRSQPEESQDVLEISPKVANSTLVSRSSWLATLFSAGVRSMLLGVTLSALFFLFPASPKQDVLGANLQSPSSHKPSLFQRELMQKLAPEEISATSAVVFSTKKNKLLFAKNPDLKLPPASTTKILTALVALHEFDLSEVVEVPENCTKLDSSMIGLKPGEPINVESLLYATLVSSAGDAACTLATHKFSDSVFIAKMNLLAQKLELKGTTLNNVIGLDQDEISHVSTARDLYLMTREALKNGTFRKIVGTREITIPSADKKYSHVIKNTNQLLFEIPGSLGVKTGTTPRAHEVLVYAYQKGDDEIIIVVMGSTDRYADTRKLLDFANTNYEYF